jgi:Flp pilus assembly protein TadG
MLEETPATRSRPLSGLRRVHEDEEGAALVEFVLVFPIQLALTMTVIQFALVLYAHIVVYQAATLGARAAAVADLMPGISAEAAASRVVARQVAALTPLRPAGTFSTAGAVRPSGADGDLRWQNDSGSHGYSTQRQDEAYNLLARAVTINAVPNPPGVFACDVAFDYVMIIPVGAQFIAEFNALVTATSVRRGSQATFPVHRVGFFVAPWLVPPSNQ